jgi:hypothetical protein
MRENELYEPMRIWLERYMIDKYVGWTIFSVDSHSERLDRVLGRYGIILEQAVGVDIQIDVLGIAKKKDTVRLVFIEAKVTQLTLRDLGQLWAYCKLIDPYEAFLFTSKALGSLDNLLNTYGRVDLLDFGESIRVKQMTIGKWNQVKKSPDLLTLIPPL